MRRAAAVAVLCMGLGGCGAQDAARVAAERVDPVAEAAEKTVAAGGARLSGDMEMTFRGQQGSLPFTIDGAVSFADDRGRITMDLPDRIRGLSDRDIRKTREEMELPYHQLQDGDVMYQSDDRIREAGVSKGISWIRVDLGEIDDEAGTSLANLSHANEANPQEMLRFLQASGGARREGPDTIGGVPATRWHADIRLSDYPRTVAPEEREEAEKTVRLLQRSWGNEPMPMTVWIDDDGLIRRERFTITMREQGEEVELDARIDLLDIGKSVKVELPDDDAVEDVTDAVAEKVGK
jgi:hypothetical protein